MKTETDEYLEKKQDERNRPKKNNKDQHRWIKREIIIDRQGGRKRNVKREYDREGGGEKERQSKKENENTENEKDGEEER